MMKTASVFCIIACFMIGFMGSAVAQKTPSTVPGQDWRIHSWERPTPPVVDPGETTNDAPSDAIVLFDGDDLDNWVASDGSESGWIIRDGVMESVKGAGYIRTLRGFGDCQLHVEFRTPTPPEGTSQGRGNSGVFLMGRYEVQVLDSYNNRTYADGQCSAIYGQHPPQVNVSRAPGQWQTYDILFKAPRFDRDENLVSPAYITIFQNGVLVHNNVEIYGPTNWCSRSPYSWHPEKLPLALQDHGNPVRYRNIWVRELPATGNADAYRPELFWGDEVLDAMAGTYKRGNHEIKITKKGGVLETNYPGSAPHRLYSESKSRWYSKFVNAEYEFVMDGDEVSAVKISVTNGGWGEYEKVD